LLGDDYNQIIPFFRNLWWKIYNRYVYIIEIHNHSIYIEEIHHMDFKSEFKKRNAWGLSTAINICSGNTEYVKDPDMIRRFVKELCEKIDMVPYGEPVVEHFGREEHLSGYTLMQMIETSSITAHFCDTSGDIYLDVFSCKEYDPYEVAEFAADFFEADYFMLFPPFFR